MTRPRSDKQTNECGNVTIRHFFLGSLFSSVRMLFRLPLTWDVDTGSRTVCPYTERNNNNDDNNHRHHHAHDNGILFSFATTISIPVFVCHQKIDAFDKIFHEFSMQNRK